MGRMKILLIFFGCVQKIKYLCTIQKQKTYIYQLIV